MSSPRVLVHDQSEMYELLQGGDGHLYLAVLCGGIGMYEVDIRLNDEEVEAYRQQGKDALAKTANRVRRDRQAFSDRVVAKVPD